MTATPPGAGCYDSRGLLQRNIAAGRSYSIQSTGTQSGPTPGPTSTPLLWQYQSARDTERVLHGLSVLDH